MKKQFVIQEHTTPEDVHWDLMLEMEDCLWTWRLNTPPAEIENEPISAERIHDHPLRFLSYEGPVQNKTGHVKIADQGLYQIIEQTDISLVALFEGQILSGTFGLYRLDEKKHWKLEKR
ncbi:MAG: DNA polymerase ligase N-terminal domain-containing protein [Planctomycetota bacterium]